MEEIPADAVYLLTGYRADTELLCRAGILLNERRAPVHDPETFETNVPGIYVVGHFTNARHIKAAIDVPRQVMPLIAQSMRTAAGKA